MHSGPGEAPGRDPPLLLCYSRQRKAPRSQRAQKEEWWHPAYPSSITGSCGTALQQPDCKKYPLPRAMLRTCLIHLYLMNTAFPHSAGCRDAQHHQHPARAAWLMPCWILPCCHADKAGMGGSLPCSSSGQPPSPCKACAEGWSSASAPELSSAQLSCGGH